MCGPFRKLSPCCKRSGRSFGRRPPKARPRLIVANARRGAAPTDKGAPASAPIQAGSFRRRGTAGEVRAPSLSEAGSARPALAPRGRQGKSKLLGRKFKARGSEIQASFFRESGLFKGLRANPRIAPRRPARVDVRRGAAGRSRPPATDDERRTVAKTEIRRAPPLFRVPKGQAFFEADAESARPEPNFSRPATKKPLDLLAFPLRNRALSRACTDPWRVKFLWSPPWLTKAVCVP